MGAQVKLEIQCARDSIGSVGRGGWFAGLEWLYQYAHIMVLLACLFYLELWIVNHNHNGAVSS